MLPSDQLGSIDRLWETLNPAQRDWLPGHLSDRSRETQEPQGLPSPKSLSLRIFCATETGNAKDVAYRLRREDVVLQGDSSA